MISIFSAFEMMVEEASARDGVWHFEYQEIEAMPALQKHFKSTNPEDAIISLKKYLSEYFHDRNIRPIVQIRMNPPCVKILSKEGADFVIQAKKIRGNKAMAKKFENLVAEKLHSKLPGLIYNLGTPRKNNTETYFKARLEELGIDTSKRKKINDGGLDIVWITPLGKSNAIPFINFQCKNTEVFGDSAKSSHNDAKALCTLHRIFRGDAHLFFAVFNSYLSDLDCQAAAGRGYAHLGILELMPDLKPKKYIQL